TTTPPTSLPAATLPATTVPATSTPATTAPPTTAPATTVPATSTPAATAGQVPGSGPGAGGPAVPGAGQPDAGKGVGTDQGGAGDIARDLVQGDAGRAARRAIESLRRELSDLSRFELALYGLLALLSLGLTVIAATTLWWMLHAWRTPASLMATRVATAARRAA